MNVLRITRSVLTVVLIAGALFAPVAAASTFEERHPSLGDAPAATDSGSSGTAPAGDPSPSAGYSSLNSITGASPSQPTVASASPSSPEGGFDWGDATIGAAVLAAILAITTGVALEVGRRRRPRPEVA